ncbi:MAG TPA: type I-E CRISPR-associated protein Cas5/CasD [Gammaproteobacteria bacterium]|nr:type I-E CRISPR-associated protein Cas5/CasD [Gammaproteobacteria bacterium]
MRYLVFRPYGPMASWGEAAVGEARPTASHPGRSAIIGMLGAALGLQRDDHERQHALRDGVRVAVKQSSPGVLLRDYHTAQVPAQQRKIAHYTRREELSIPKHRLHTILSTREYRCDGYWTVAVTTTTEAPWTVDDLAAALREPQFPLCLGRRAFPLTAPVYPQVVEAEGVRAALDTPFPALTPLDDADEHRRLALQGEQAYAWEGDGGDIEAQETRFPSDEPLHRGRWQFTVRPESWCIVREDP